MRETARVEVFGANAATKKKIAHRNGNEIKQFQYHHVTQVFCKAVRVKTYLKSSFKFCFQIKSEKSVWLWLNFNSFGIFYEWNVDALAPLVEANVQNVLPTRVLSVLKKRDFLNEFNSVELYRFPGKILVESKLNSTGTISFYNLKQFSEKKALSIRY